eukprot:gnl/Chilomastix_cuspidata/3395.p1 GENE.gnl/Chilomastix_cuspidata/3395~~gnl/Chilomastix_cuspidata/3395.p1  ORF type:complete len:1269 (-),score=409.17 gnl/Chilomastix_cuspidata/3395:5-3811(-)
MRLLLNLAPGAVNVRKSKVIRFCAADVSAEFIVVALSTGVVNIYPLAKPMTCISFRPPIASQITFLRISPAQSLLAMVTATGELTILTFPAKPTAEGDWPAPQVVYRARSEEILVRSPLHWVSEKLLLFVSSGKRVHALWSHSHRTKRAWLHTQIFRADSEVVQLSTKTHAGTLHVLVSSLTLLHHLTLARTKSADDARTTMLVPSKPAQIGSNPRKPSRLGACVCPSFLSPKDEGFPTIFAARPSLRMFVASSHSSRVLMTFALRKTFPEPSAPAPAEAQPAWPPDGAPQPQLGLLFPVRIGDFPEVILSVGEGAAALIAPGKKPAVDTFAPLPETPVARVSVCTTRGHFLLMTPDEVFLARVVPDERDAQRLTVLRAVAAKQEAAARLRAERACAAFEDKQGEVLRVREKALRQSQAAAARERGLMALEGSLSAQLRYRMMSARSLVALELRRMRLEDTKAHAWRTRLQNARAQHRKEAQDKAHAEWIRLRAEDTRAQKLRDMRAQRSPADVQDDRAKIVGSIRDIFTKSGKQFKTVAQRRVLKREQMPDISEINPHPLGQFLRILTAGVPPLLRVPPIGRVGQEDAQAGLETTLPIPFIVFLPGRSKSLRKDAALERRIGALVAREGACDETELNEICALIASLSSEILNFSRVVAKEHGLERAAPSAARQIGFRPLLSDEFRKIAQLFMFAQPLVPRAFRSSPTSDPLRAIAAGQVANAATMVFAGDVGRALSTAAPARETFDLFPSSFFPAMRGSLGKDVDFASLFPIAPVLLPAEALDDTLGQLAQRFVATGDLDFICEYFVLLRAPRALGRLFEAVLTEAPLAGTTFDRTARLLATFDNTIDAAEPAERNRDAADVPASSLVEAFSSATELRVFFPFAQGGGAVSRGTDAPEGLLLDSAREPLPEALERLVRAVVECPSYMCAHVFLRKIVERFLAETQVMAVEEALRAGSLLGQALAESTNVQLWELVACLRASLCVPGAEHEAPGIAERIAFGRISEGARGQLPWLASPAALVFGFLYEFDPRGECQWGLYASHLSDRASNSLQRFSDPAPALRAAGSAALLLLSALSGAQSRSLEAALSDAFGSPASRRLARALLGMLPPARLLASSLFRSYVRSGNASDGAAIAYALRHYGGDAPELLGLLGCLSDVRAWAAFAVPARGALRGGSELPSPAVTRAALSAVGPLSTLSVLAPAARSRFGRRLGPSELRLIIKAQQDAEGSPHLGRVASAFEFQELFAHSGRANERPGARPAWAPCKYP